MPVGLLTVRPSRIQSFPSSVSELTGSRWDETVLPSRLTHHRRSCRCGSNISRGSFPPANPPSIPHRPLTIPFNPSTSPPHLPFVRTYTCTNDHYHHEHHLALCPSHSVRTPNVRYRGVVPTSNPITLTLTLTLTLTPDVRPKRLLRFLRSRRGAGGSEPPPRRVRLRRTPR